MSTDMRLARSSSESATMCAQRYSKVCGKAKNFQSVAAPLIRGPEGGNALTLIYLAPGGSFVKQGDLVADIDAQSVKDHMDDIEAMIAQLDANVRKRQAQQALNWETLQQNIRVLKSRLDKAKLDASASEIRTVIDA